MRSLKVIARRLLLLIPVLIGVSLVTFTLTRVLPGSPVLIYLLFYTWHLFPAPVGRLSMAIRAPAEVTGLLLVDSALVGNWAAWQSAAHQLALPVLVLAFGAVAPIARMARSSMLDV